MANAFLHTDWLAMRSLYHLKNKLSIASGFNWDFNKEFTKPFAIGETLTIKFPQRFIGGNGLGYNPESINRRSTTVTMDQLPHVHFDWDSYEKAINMERGDALIEEEYIKPAMSTLAQTIDSLAAQYAYLHASNIVGTLGTDPTTFDAVSGAARQRLIELACPQNDWMMVVPPRLMRALKTTAIALLNPVSTISKQARTGIITEKTDNFDWYESMSLYSHTSGLWAGAVTVTTTSVEGATTLALTCTTGDTFLRGDVIAVTSANEVNPETRRASTTRAKQFVILASVTGVASAATVSVSPAIYGPGSQYQNVSAYPTAGATVTLFPGTTFAGAALTGVNSLAFHRNAFAMVSVDLEMPKSVEPGSGQKRDPETGISIRFTRSWDWNLSRMVNRFDCLLGFGSLYSDECAVRVLGA